MEKRIENEQYRPELDEFEQEPIFFGIGPWKISYTGTRTPSFLEKMQMWWWSFRGELLRIGLIFFALGSVFWSGLTVGSKMHAPVVNATMGEQVEKPGSGAWAPRAWSGAGGDK